MKVYIILEHQLEYGDYNFSTIAGTRVVDVFLNKEDAESEADFKRSIDKQIVEKHLCDPCEYEVQEWEVTE